MFLTGIYPADKLFVTKIDFSTACNFVNQYHRHHKAPQGHKFSIGCFWNAELLGVAIVGRPIGRFLDNGQTLEVTRLCAKPDTKNVCSKLYASCAKIARKMGYKKVITYTLMSENGASLKASKFTLEAENVGGLKWRTRGSSSVSTEFKKRWSITIKI